MEMITTRGATLLLLPFTLITLSLSGCCKAPAPAPVRHTAESVDPAVKRQLSLLSADLAVEKVAILSASLELSPEQSDLFWPIYREFEQKLAGLNEGLAKNVAAYATNPQDDVKADAAARKALEWELQRAKSKQEAYDKIAKALSPRVAARFLVIENQIESANQLQFLKTLPFLLQRVPVTPSTPATPSQPANP